MPATCAQIYCCGPLALYIAERAWRLVRNVAFKGDLLDVELLPGKSRGGGGGVTVLRMRRPRDFNYRCVSLRALGRRQCLPRSRCSGSGGAKALQQTPPAPLQLTVHLQRRLAHCVLLGARRLHSSSGRVPPGCGTSGLWCTC